MEFFSSPNSPQILKVKIHALRIHMLYTRIYTSQNATHFSYSVTRTGQTVYSWIQIPTLLYTDPPLRFLRRNCLFFMPWKNEKNPYKCQLHLKMRNNISINPPTDKQTVFQLLIFKFSLQGAHIFGCHEQRRVGLPGCRQWDRHWRHRGGVKVQGRGQHK